MCIICCKTQHKGVREKHRICETLRAKKVLNAVSRMQDEVYDEFQIWKVNLACLELIYIIISCVLRVTSGNLIDLKQ